MRYINLNLEFSKKILKIAVKTPNAKMLNAKMLNASS